MIEFNRAPYVGTETQYMQKSDRKRKTLRGRTVYQRMFRLDEETLSYERSAAHHLVHPRTGDGSVPGGHPAGDEVIMPSYTFVSTADAFVLRGARIVFVDIRPDTMNLDENKIEDAVTEKTKAIVPVHYAGVACAMDEILEIAGTYHLKVIEDAAQGVHAAYKGRALGTIGDFGCYSFHETKKLYDGRRRRPAVSG